MTLCLCYLKQNLLKVFFNWSELTKKNVIALFFVAIVLALTGKAYFYWTDGGSVDSNDYTAKEYYVRQKTHLIENRNG